MKRAYLLIATSSIVSLAVGGLSGWALAKRQLEKKYDAQLQEETKATREFYQKLNQKREYETAEAAAEDLAPEAIAAMRTYRGEPAPEHKVVVEKVIQNIFADGDATDEIPEAEKRNRTEEAPYILEKEEYLRNESGFVQTTVTYFAGDKILIDSRDDIIEEIDKTVGEIHLERFGHGSGDPRVLYVRNDILDLEFEILLHDGKYSQHVAGL
jgi:hypothetical protein